MSEAHLHRLEAKRFSNFGGECMPQPVRRPRADARTLGRPANGTCIGIPIILFAGCPTGIRFPIRAGAVATTYWRLAGLMLGRTSFAFRLSRGEAVGIRGPQQIW